MTGFKRCLILLLVLLLLAGCAAREEQTPPPPDRTNTGTEPTQSTEEATEPAVLPPARRIAEGYQLFVGEQDRTTLLTDRDHNTKITLTDTQPLVMESTTPVHALYLIWDTVPGSYTISWDNGELACGANGFLHEYVELPHGMTRLTFRFSQDCTPVLCDATGYTEGTAHPEVQLWQPPCEQADILVFPTHSDDDALFFGALISYYAIERQLTVQTAFMVDHTWQPHRGHERLNGLWAMGIRHYPILGAAPDTATFDFTEAMNLYAPSDILGWQTELIRRFRPLVVVGHDLNGEYGNAGHKVNAHYLTQAIFTAADPESYPDSAALWGTWETPKLYLHLYAENEWYLDVNTPMTNDPQGRTPFEAAQDGFAAHVSQQQWGVVQQNDNNRAYDCRRFGLYYSAVGPDTTADVMENVTIEQYR